MGIENALLRDESREEIIHGLEISIELNPDHYRGGFVWSVCRDENELDCGLAFTEEDALAEAHQAIGGLGLSLG